MYIVLHVKKGKISIIGQVIKSSVTDMELAWGFPGINVNRVKAKKQLEI